MAKFDVAFDARDHPANDHYNVRYHSILGTISKSQSRKHHDTFIVEVPKIGRLVGAECVTLNQAISDIKSAVSQSGANWRNHEKTILNQLDFGIRSAKSQPVALVPISYDVEAPDFKAATPNSEKTQKATNAAIVYEGAGPTIGTRGAVNLAGRRLNAIPPNVRYSTDFHGIVYPLTTPDGTVTAIQKIYLNQDGTNVMERDDKGELKKKKITNGDMRNGMIVFRGKPGPIILVDGPEDALAAHQATGFTALAACSKTRFPHAADHLTAGDTLIVVRDADGTDNSEYGRAVKAFAAKRLVVVWIDPPAPSKDVNDILRADGDQAVREWLEAALATVEAPAPINLPPTITADEARAMVESVIGASIDGAVRYWEAMRDFQRDAFLLEQGFPLVPPVTRNTDIRGQFEPIPEVTALRSDTGVGKSSIFRQLAPKLLAAAPGRKIVVAVPRVDLAREAAREARTLGLRAMAFAGRDRVVEGADADDPKPETMCVDLFALKDAVDATVGIQKSICSRKVEGGELKCDSFGVCQYQLQRIVAENSDIIFLAHEYLFHEKPEFINELSMLVIDESFYDVGLSRGSSLTLASLKKDRLIWHSNKDMLGKVDFNRSADLSTFQSMLVQALEDNGKGYLQRASLEWSGITTDIAHDAKALAWALWEDPGIYPGMDAADRRKRAATVYDTNKFAVKLAAVWNCIIQMYAAGYPASGHLVFGVVDSDKDDGDIMGLSIKYRKDIHPGWKAPTLILDATLRPELVLPYFNWIKLVDTPAVSMPHATVALIEGAPTTEHKAIAGKSAREKDKVTARNHQIDLHRFLLLRSIGRRKVLMVAQQALEAKLLTLGLPSRFDTAHHNAVAGLDCWKAVDQLFVLGRTAPGPQGVELITAALTGYPVKLTDAGRWYGRVTSAITLRDGREHRMDIDQHSHPVAEAVRWVITEGQLVQVIGRARGVNRTSDSPVEIVIMADVVLPVIVDRIESWKAPSRCVEMVLEGAWIESAADRSRCWPDVWPTQRAAESDMDPRTHGNAYMENLLKAFTGVLCRYQLAGAGQKMRSARFGLNMVPNPRSWLESRLGPLAKFEMAEAPIRTTTMVVMDVRVWISDDGRRWFREPIAANGAKHAAVIHDRGEASRMVAQEMLRAVNVGIAVSGGLMISGRELLEMVNNRGWVGWMPTKATLLVKLM